MKKHNNSEALAIATKNNWEESWLITAKYKDEIFNLLFISKKKDMREIVFEARPDTKQTHYLLLVDSKNKILKILSNPKDYE